MEKTNTKRKLSFYIRDDDFDEIQELWALKRNEYKSWSIFCSTLVMMGKIEMEMG